MISVIIKTSDFCYYNLKHMLHVSISRSDNTFSGKDLQTAQVALRKKELIN